ncbi:MAG: helix-turn-helix domain-containing protein [Synechococcales bacterium]|nr:helix-turn-helix domain-containing protein [Synechococcales bacterium]
MTKQLMGPETIAPRIAQAFVDLVLSSSAELDRVEPQRDKDQVIYGILHGQFTRGEQVMEQAQRLGLDLTPPRAVILINASEFIYADPSTLSCQQSKEAQQRSQYITDSIVSFFHLPNDTICADLGNGEFVVLKASDTRNMGSWAMHDGPPPVESATSSWTNLEAVKRAGNALLSRLRRDTGAPMSVGIGRYHPGVLGLSRSYQDAQVALRLGRQFSGQNQVYCLDGLGIAAFACVADEQTKVELATHLLSPLDNEPDLLDTLDTFFRLSCAASATAKQLSIHRNTLSYRLEKVASLTGLDPRCFDEAVQIRLALLLRGLEPS